MQENKKKRAGNAKIAGNDLTPRQEAFVEEFIQNGNNGVQATLKAYPNQTYGSAEVTTNRLLSNARVLERIQNIDDEIEDTMLDVMRGARAEFKANKSVKHGALAAGRAEYLHDKRHGRATQRIEQHSTVVSLGIDLSGTASPNSTHTEPV